MDAFPNGMDPPADMQDMMAQQGMTAAPSWLITTAICVALSALVFALIKVTSKCLLPIAAILLTGSILAVLMLVTMGVTQVYTMIGTNATSPVQVFRTTCSTMPLVGGELILVITSVCAFCIGIGCMMCIFAGARRGHHVWAESTGGLGGVGAMATFCVVGVPFAMIGIAVASAVVVIRCAPQPENNTLSDNQTWVPIPEWARPVPLRHTPPWSQSRYTSWNHEDADAVPIQRTRTRVRQPLNRGAPSFRVTQEVPPPPRPEQPPRSEQPPPQPPRMRRITTAEPSQQSPPFESFHHLVHHDENEQQNSPSRMASTRSETKTKYEPPIANIRFRAIPPPPDQAAAPSATVPPPLITKRVFIGNATMSKVIKMKAKNGTFIAIL